MHHIVVHSTGGVQPLVDYKNAKRSIEGVFESLPFSDGSVLAIITTYDPGILIQLPRDVSGVMALPHPHTSRNLGVAAGKLPKELNAKSTDSLEAVLLAAIAANVIQPRFHPDLF